MDFDLTEEQRLLQDSVARLLADRYKFEQRKAYMKTPEGWSREIWSAYAELGLLALPFAEAEGGYGGGAEETMIVAEQMGRALTLEPWLPTVVLGGGFLRHGASAEQRSALVPKIARGEMLLAFAHTEAQSRYDLHDVTTTAKRDGDGWVLNGRKVVVIHGDSAHRLVVTARTAGGQRDLKGIGVFLVDASAPGVSRRGFTAVDGHRAAEVTLEGVRVGPEAVLGNPEDGLPLVDRVVDEAIAALAAEAVGAMEAVHGLTLEYLKTRKQFGRPIGSFQGVAFQLADAFTTIAEAWNLCLYAAWALDVRNDDAELVAHQAKASAGRAALFAAERCIQVHGGIGITMEADPHLFLRRALAGDAWIGQGRWHDRRAGALRVAATLEGAQR